jgi:hypothetical protein
MPVDWAIVIIVGWTALAFLGGWVANQKGRDPGEGVLLGILFGPLGVVVEGLLPDGKPLEKDRAEEEPDDRPLYYPRPPGLK